LFARGVIVTYEAIRTWCRKFGQAYVNQLRLRRLYPGDKWHLDEVFWVIVIFDTAGEVSFAGISTPRNPDFRIVLNVNRAYFRLRQQYHFW
jgi:transposase-like protein